MPSVTSLSPSSANAGGPSFTLVLNVTGVFLNVVVNFGSTALQNTSFLNGQVTVTVPSSLITQAGVVNVTITSNGETSNSLPFIVNAPPTVASPASANPTPVTATTANLSVLGADDAGEANLTYTWATAGTPPASVTISSNGTNAAKNTVATFTKAGNYTFQVTIRDQGGLAVTSAVNVTVNQTVTTLTVTPATANVVTGGTQQFTATALDQFKMPIVPPPPFQWTASGGGTINQTGLFTAGRTPAGPFAITVSAGNGSAVAQVTVVPGSAVAYVQGASATNDNSAGSIARAFAAANTAGNLIVAAVSWGNSSGVTCSDSQGNTYAVATIQTDALYNQSLAICYAANVKGGTNTVTATFSGTPSYRRLLIHEYQGIALVNPVDVVAKNVANGTTTTNGVTSTAAVTTSSGDLIFGAVMDDFQYSGIAAGTGFTQRLSVNNKDMATEDLVQAASGPIAATHTFGAPDRYLAQMVTFRQR